MWSALRVALSFPLIILFAAVASAQTLEQVDRCAGRDAPTPEEKIAACTAVVQAGPSQGGAVTAAFRSRAEAYFAKRDYAHAIADAGEAILLDPSTPMMHFLRGLALNATGKHRLAIIGYDAAIDLDPNDPYFYTARAISELKLKDTKGALRDVDRALQLNPEFQAARQLRSRLAEALDDSKEVQSDRKEQDTFCAFLARRIVRGELKAGSSGKIPDYCGAAKDAAKSCVEQKCSTAAIIDQQERINSEDHLPWGADDYQGIKELEK